MSSSLLAPVQTNFQDNSWPYGSYVNPQGFMTSTSMPLHEPHQTYGLEEQWLGQDLFPSVGMNPSMATRFDGGNNDILQPQFKPNCDKQVTVKTENVSDGERDTRTMKATRSRRGSVQKKRGNSTVTTERERHLERNRQAAERHRQKRKLDEGVLQHQMRELETRNTQLHDAANSLRFELLELKEMCLGYINCGCDRGSDRVREYMLQSVTAASEATESVTSTSPVSPASGGLRG